MEFVWKSQIAAEPTSIVLEDAIYVSNISVKELLRMCAVSLRRNAESPAQFAKATNVSRMLDTPAVFPIWIAMSLAPIVMETNVIGNQRMNAVSMTKIVAEIAGTAITTNALENLFAVSSIHSPCTRVTLLGIDQLKWLLIDS